MTETFVEKVAPCLIFKYIIFFLNVTIKFVLRPASEMQIGR